MKFSTLQILAIFSLLSVGFLTFAPFVQIADAHPQEIISRSLRDLVVCEEDGTIVEDTVVWGQSEIVIPHDPNGSHEMNVRHVVGIRNVEYITCGSMG